MVKEEIVQEVKTSRQFSVIVDETKDVPKKSANLICSEVIYTTVCFTRALWSLKWQKTWMLLLLEVIGLYASLKSTGWSWTTRKPLLARAMAVRRWCTGPMQPRQIKEGAKRAFYVRCSAHLVIVHAVKSVANAGNVFSWLERQRVFMLDTQHVALVWTGCLPLSRCLRRLHLGNIHKEYWLELIRILLLFSSESSLRNWKFISDRLRAKTVDRAKAGELIEALTETLAQYRCPASFEEMRCERLDLYQLP